MYAKRLEKERLCNRFTLSLGQMDAFVYNAF